MKQRFLSVLFFTVVLLISCSDRSNPLDENSSEYVPPSFEIISTSGGIADGDTVHVDTATLHLEGNSPLCLFRFSINGLWTDWQDSGKIHFSALDDTNYTIKVEIKYQGGTVITDSIINFVVMVNGYKPHFTGNDTLFYRTLPGINVQIPVGVTGQTPMQFTWMKDGSPIPSQITDTLRFTPFTIEDTGLYQCMAENTFGRDTGRAIVLRLKIEDSTDSLFFTLTVVQGKGGTVSRNLEKEQYRFNDSITLLATPADGYGFDYWDGDISGTDPLLTFAITKNIIVRAVFSPVITGPCTVLQHNESITEAIKAVMTSTKRGEICVSSGVYNQGAVNVNGALKIIIK